MGSFKRMFAVLACGVLIIVGVVATIEIWRLEGFSRHTLVPIAATSLGILGAIINIAELRKEIAWEEEGQRNRLKRELKEVQKKASMTPDEFAVYEQKIKEQEKEQTEDARKASMDKNYYGKKVQNDWLKEKGVQVDIDYIFERKYDFIRYVVDTRKNCVYFSKMWNKKTEVYGTTDFSRLKFEKIIGAEIREGGMSTDRAGNMILGGLIGGVAGAVVGSNFANEKVDSLRLQSKPKTLKNR